jgi:isopenicillin N synthase-like dioxygenase
VGGATAVGSRLQEAQVMGAPSASAAPILDVDLLAFERGDRAARAAVVDGVRRSLVTGFVYTSHDLSEALLDDAYGMLAAFFECPAEEKATYVAAGSHGQTGYTGLLVETAATSDHADWKEMLNWGRDIPAGHPLRRRYPHRYMDQVLPEAAVPGISAVLNAFHDRTFDLQRRFLRVIALGIGCAEDFFDRMLTSGPTLTRAIHYPAMQASPGADHVWAAEHGDINLITALPRATARGLQVQTADGWIDAVPPEGKVVINTGMMLEQLTNGVIPTGCTGSWPTPRRRATATRSCSSATRRRGRSSPRWRAASPPTGPSATAPSRPATASTRSSGRSTSSRTPAPADRRHPRRAQATLAQPCESSLDPKKPASSFRVKNPA